MQDINWNVTFEITMDGESKNFWELPEDAQQEILRAIASDSYSGTFTKEA